MTTVLTMPLAVDLVAVGVGSLQGALFAAGFKRLDLLGVALIGVATGVGGGFLRDVLLGVPPAVLSSNYYLITATGAAFLGMWLPHLFRKLDPAISLLDALSLGLFGAIGTTKALALGLPVIPALFVGTAAAVGGGIVRDIVLNIPIALMHVGSFYAVAAMAGNITLLTLMLGFDVSLTTSAIACVAVTTVLRMLAMRFGWSLPEQRALSRVRLRRQRQVEEIIEEALHTGAITIPVEMLLDHEDGDITKNPDDPGAEPHHKHGR